MRIGGESNVLKELFNLKTIKSRPFHDDPLLQQLVSNLITEHQIKTFFETGTFKGDTIRWVADRFKKLNCVSVEKNRIYYRYAIGKTWNSKVQLLYGDSRKLLPDAFIPQPWPILYWLDAHWKDDDWPLMDELRIIRESRSAPCIIMIDDFKVPNHPSLQYDSYKGLELSYDFIKNRIGDSKVFVPNYDAVGMCGYAVIFQNLPSNTERYFLEELK
jgi:hypothetical protein